MVFSNTMQYIGVKLSKDGRKVLNDFYKRLYPNKVVNLSFIHYTDSEGFTKFQVWEVAQIYQDYLYGNSSINPFDSNEVKIYNHIKDDYGLSRKRAR